MANFAVADGAAEDRSKGFHGDQHRLRVVNKIDPSVTTIGHSGSSGGVGENLVSLLHEFVAGVLHHGGDGADSSPRRHVVHRLRSSFGKTAPRLREASTNSARDLHHWSRRGSALRALLIISVGGITLIGLTSSLVFTFLLIIATLNAVIISLITSLAVSGGFLAIFFVCLAAVYFGALSVAFLTISTITIFTIIAVMIAAGWLAFFCIIWLSATKAVHIVKQSCGMATSAISAYTAARHESHNAKLSD